MAERIPQSTTIRVPLKAYLSSDHLSPATSQTIAVVISRNMGGFANPSAGATNATELSNGWYYIDLSTIDTGTLGPLIVRGTCANTDDVEAVYDVSADGATLAEIGADVDEIITTLGVAGLGLTNLGDVRIGHLDVDVSSRLAGTSYTAPDNADISAIKTDVESATSGLAALLAAIKDVPAAVWTQLVEGGLDAADVLRIALAALAGISDGGGTTLINFWDQAKTKKRIAATVDSRGDRTAVTVIGD